MALLQRIFQATLIALTAWLAGTGTSLGYTANKVWFEFRPDGRFRVHVNYTIPELKEFRDCWVDFAKRKAAERFYWDLVRGADFFPPSPEQRTFKVPKQGPEPW